MVSVADSLRFSCRKVRYLYFGAAKAALTLEEKRLNRAERKIFHPALQAVPNP